MRFFLVFCLIWLMLYISACSFNDNKAKPGPRLAEINFDSGSATQPIGIELSEPIPAISNKQLLNNYREVLKTVNEPKLRQDIQLRLADLELRESENLLVEGISEKKPFEKAIQMYLTLLDEIDLAEPDGNEDKARLQYQLSKAYSLAGRNEESNSVLELLAKDQRIYDNSEEGLHAQEPLPKNNLIVESYFRLAEAAFNRGDYESARKQYLQVIEEGGLSGGLPLEDASGFQQNAYYMLGWSEFKLNRYGEALSTFMHVLDPLLEPVSGFDLEERDAPAKGNLSSAEQNLIADSLRAMSIAFSYLGGAESIEELLSLEGERSYSHLFYQKLGELYRAQERYRDAADTYLAYVKYQPFSASAPSFSGLAIQIYYEGNFPSLILPAKEDFVAAYGIDSLFWLSQSSSDLDLVKPFLHEYLQELSSHYHSVAQVVPESVNKGANQELLLAADYYGQFVATFPEDSKTPEMAFLQAEALFDAGDYIKAAKTYDFVAYQIAESIYGHKSAYNLILAIDQILMAQDLKDQSEADWQQQKLAMSIRFANRYPNDQRAPAVLSQAMDIQFSNKKYAEAVEIADWLISLQTERLVQAELLQHATLLAAEAEFIQEHFFAAEMRYRQFLEAVSADDERVGNAQVQIMASLYRQAEVLQTAGDKQLAVDRFLAAADFLSRPDNGKKTINSDALEIAAVARFDAANSLMEMEKWPASIEQFVTFLEQYPQHKLATSIPAKLAFLYQETDQWQLAADNLLTMLEEPSTGIDSDDHSVKPSRAFAGDQSQALYLAAQLYQRAESLGKAKETYERYVGEYPESGLLVMESQYQLALMSEGIERDRWVDQLTKVVDQSDRAIYLNVWAANEQADQVFQRYNSKQIYLPLKNSLKIKQQALEETIDAYKKVLGFGVAEFTTLASYRMAEVYAGLSHSVINSERPGDLDALALEQYEILLEEQAFPFEEKAIELHEANAQRSWEGGYDFWVQQSFDSLGMLLPGRYNKVETRVEVSHGIH